MGVDTYFKVRHKLNANTIDSLVEDLKLKVHSNTRPYMNSVDIEYLDKYGLDIPYYANDDSLAEIYVEDDDYIFDKLFEKYNNVDLIIKKLKELYSSNLLIEESMNGVRHFCVNDNLYERERPTIWGVTNNTIHGTPNVWTDRWCFFDRLFNNQYNKDEVACFIECRKKFYEKLKHIIDDNIVYYYADQTEIEEYLSYTNNFDDIPNYVKSKGYKILSLSDFILRPNGFEYHTDDDFIIKDDFKDILL